MPRVLLVVVAFAAATTALPHRLRRAKPEKSAADDHDPKPRTPSLAALESFLGGTAAEPVSRTLDGLDPEVALERASLTGMAREVGRLPDWEAVDGEEFSVLMEVGRVFRSSRGELVGPDVAQGKVACDDPCEKIAAGAHGQVYFGQARIRVHEKTSSSIFSSAVTDTDFTGSVVIKQSLECMFALSKDGKPSDVTKEQNILRHLQKNRHEEGGANLMNVYGFFTMKPGSHKAKDEWKCDIIAEKVPYPITWEKKWHPTAVGEFIRQALLGLGFMHRHHVAHLDLKPENIMSMRDTKLIAKGDIRLADGDIKLIDTGGGVEDRKTMHWFEGEFTREIGVATPEYAAPELKEVVTSGGAKNVEIKPYKADIWSMGMVAVALLCGEDNYDDKAMKRLKMKAITSQDDAAAFVHTVFPFTATDKWRTAEYKKARDFVNAALRFNPEERPTVEALLKMEFVA